jgi:hypothetical protein
LTLVASSSDCRRLADYRDRARLLSDEKIAISNTSFRRGYYSTTTIGLPKEPFKQFEAAANATA